jgi:predicted Rossmann fold flavoprotein
MSNRHIAVIGGGAAGLIASISAARGGARVTLFEKQKKCGRKLAITGNGQCNISNRNADPSHYHGKNPQFVRNVFARFGVNDTVQFFDSIGIPLIEKKNGKLYPRSLSAQLVTDILEYHAKAEGVTILENRRADRIMKKNGRIAVITAGHEEFSCDAVILAAGSCAYPQLGASEQGYEIASALGHSIVKPFPSILPINIPLKILHRLEGIKWDCGLKVRFGGKILSASTGEVLFTKYGLSGPASLEISRAVNELVLSGEKPIISVNFFPDMNEHNLSAMIGHLLSDPDKPGNLALSGILKKRIPDILLEIAGFDPFAPCSSYGKSAKSKILPVLSSLELEPGPVRPFSEAVCAAGGVPVNEIDPKTMESKKFKGLYLCGEILDIDGDSGGYNLQFAWSTGFVAGKCAAAVEE